MTSLKSSSGFAKISEVLSSWVLCLCFCCLILFSRILCRPQVPSASPWNRGAGGRGFLPGFPLFFSPSARAIEIMKIVHFLSPSCPSVCSLPKEFFKNSVVYSQYEFPRICSISLPFLFLFKSPLVCCFPLLSRQWSASDPAGVIYRRSCPVEQGEAIPPLLQTRRRPMFRCTSDLAIPSQMCSA